MKKCFENALQRFKIRLEKSCEKAYKKRQETPFPGLKSNSMIPPEKGAIARQFGQQISESAWLYEGLIWILEPSNLEEKIRVEKLRRELVKNRQSAHLPQYFC